jgi:hypothetical protein
MSVFSITVFDIGDGVGYQLSVIGYQEKRCPDDR